ncbi:ankyrin repeat domain-containing protein [Rickettsia bellii]|uniref:Putative ankyrin repeat protein RBE_0997 n=1 Tax=Rickettsia bellii (strain RML369-C) TaxID=336407 RepID=Y997_RICBR|nr:ankyrin repeat domain-containing protein [Rickettsia bellii]Q1RHT6.1 RecName: Full=Putative ankyrin repeat protein RBE_0997 [Rickettsia bellii RML369-C]ABE05078.1 Ankyrin repeat [Rickettsia bellii RML369-C]ABV79087.1 Ankyrin repeat [Rickettsia bellii OSU 85-389]
MNKDEELLIEAIENDDLKEVQKLLQEGVDPNILDEDDKPCILSAIRNKNLDIVSVLLENGANPNAVDADGEPIISAAIRTKRLDIINILLENRADPNLQPPRKNTILLKAIQSNNLDIVNAFLNKGANLNALDISGYPIFLKAIKSENLEIINALLEKGANPNLVDKDGSPLLFTAINTKNLDIIDALIKMGANVEAKNKDGNTVLNVLLERRGNVNIISLLIENSQDKEKIFNLKNNNGETFLHLAAQQGNSKIFDKYLDYYPTVNITDKAGYTPLYWSKLLGHTEISNKLIERAEELKETVYTKVTRTKFFENLPSIPKIAVSYNSKVRGETSEATRNKLKYQYCNVEDIDYRKIVPESANAEKKINEEIVNEAKRKAKEFLADKDALVIPGNNSSVDPKIAEHFGGQVNLEKNKFDFARSLAEMAMLEVAIEKGMPIMGICGGHQIINAYLKGKIDEVSKHKHDSIIIEPDSELASIIKRNSPTKDILNQEFWGMHNDKVQEIGGKNRLIDNKDLLKVTATNEHREIEATESQFGAPIRTFQFHPEMSKTTYSNAEIIRDKKIFASFVQSAETFMNKKSLGADIKFKVPVKKSFTEMVLNRKEQQNNQRGI